MAFGRKATQQDITWFLDLYNNGERLDLDPAYQRKSVWSKEDKDFFIDSVINNFPCPAIFLFKDTDTDGSTIYHVVDGKQRLKTIIDFSKDVFTLSASDENLTSAVKGKKFSSLNQDQKDAFWDYTIPVEFIRTKEENEIRTIFDRLNRNNKTLTPQELRKAKYDGQLFNFVENESEDLFWQNNVRFTKRDIARMNDQQFIAELVALTLSREPQQFDQNKIDELYALNNVEFQEEQAVREKFREIKEIINNINNINSSIKTHFYTKSKFYTLWTILLLFKDKEDFEVSNIAAKLESFGIELQSERENSSNENVSTFAQYNKQATTDIQQRSKRQESLISYLEE